VVDLGEREEHSKCAHGTCKVYWSNYSRKQLFWR